MKKVLLFPLLLIGKFCIAQNVGIGTTTPHSSAALELTGTNKGFLPPRLTSAQRKGISSPAKGLMVYDSSRNNYWYYTGSTWKEVAGNNYNNDSNLIVGKQIGAIASYNLTTYLFPNDSSGYLYDDGGAAGNYSNNQNYFCTLSVLGNTLAIDITIISNNIENNNDSLMLYDNFGHTYYLMGNQTGKYRFNEDVTIHFKSNGSITQPGFAIRWDKIYSTGNQNEYDSAQISGWYFNQNKLYMRGGVNEWDNWNPDSSGRSSFAYGENAQAKGNYSVALGKYTKATGSYSFAAGQNSQATNIGAIAMGSGAKAKGGYSLALGQGTAQGTASFASGTSTAMGSGAVALGINANAIGNGSVAIGTGVTAKTYSQCVIGLLNDTTNAGSTNVIYFNDPIFQIGNGYEVFGEPDIRRNAMTVLYSGSVGLGTSFPQSKLHLVGRDDGTSPNNITIEDTIDNAKLMIGYDGFTTYKINTATNHPLQLFANNNSVGGLTLNTDGTVSTLQALKAIKDIFIDNQDINNGNITNSLRFGSSTTAEFIASKRTSGGNQYGLDFYTNGTLRLSLTNSGSVQVINNLTVQNGKGIIRSTDGTQKKQLSASITINTTFAAGETKTFTITWPETFSASPEAYVGNVAGGGGGFAELVMTVAGTSTSGATLYVYNPKTSSTSPNFSVKVVAIGAQ